MAQARVAGVARAEVGDARAVPFADGSADAVLLLGPLYHLTEADDRVRALEEARRVLVPGGVVAAAGISRFASAIDGVLKGLVRDPEFERIVENDLRDGRHLNPAQHPDWFTTAYFHSSPADLAAEVRAAGFALSTLAAVEGIGAWLPDVDAVARRPRAARTAPAHDRARGNRAEPARREPAPARGRREPRLAAAQLAHLALEAAHAVGEHDDRLLQLGDVLEQVVVGLAELVVQPGLGPPTTPPAHARRGPRSTSSRASSSSIHCCVASSSSVIFKAGPRRDHFFLNAGLEPLGPGGILDVRPITGAHGAER